MNRKSNINIAQIFVDAICLIITHVVTIFLTGSIFRPISMTEYLWMPILFGMVYIFTMFTCEMYHRSTFTYQDRTLRYVMRACILGAVFCLVMVPFTSEDPIAFNILMLYILVAIVIIAMQYLVVQELRLAHTSRWKKRAVFVGCRENIQEYLYYIKKTSFQVDVVGYIPMDDCINMQGKNLGELENLGTILKDHIIDEIIFAVPCSLMENIRAYVLMCKERGLTVRLAVDFFEGHDKDNSVHTVGTIPVFTYQNASLSDFQSFVKRSMDILGALIGICLTLIISFFVLPVILIQTGGSAFEKRTYLSVNGRPYGLYRFKTSGTEGHESLIDKFLRKTGMVNLPMFWNVLKGDMSLVGSLPVSASETRFITNDQFRSTNIKPGLTGLWRFADKNSIKDEDYLFELNERYFHKWSFIRDIWLIFKTVVVILMVRSNNIGTSLFSCMEDNHEYGVGYSMPR